MEQQYAYIGWIPCVSGRLFFEYTECGLGKDIRIDVNHIEHSERIGNYQRFILIASTVDWKDIDKNDTEGKYHVILVGTKGSEDISLSGCVYLIPENNISNVFTNIEKYISQIRQRVEYKEQIGNLYNDLVSVLDGLNSWLFYKVNYLVESPGFVKLNYSNNDSDGDDYPSNHKVTVCRQAYYYIKYSLHKHRHHHDNAESLTTIHDLGLEKERIGIKLLNDLRRSLVQIKRDAEEYDGDNLFRAMGIASYATALAESCYREEYLSKDDYESERTYFESIKSSVEVMANCVDRELTKSIAISSNARAIIVFLLSIVAPFLLIFRENINDALNSKTPSVIIGLFATAINTDFKIVVIVLVFLSFFLMYYLLSKKYGTYFLAFNWYRTLLVKIVYDRYKGNILSIVFAFVFLGAIFLSLYNILAK